MATIPHLLALVAVVAPVVYSQTCYVAPGVPADSSVVPCGGSGVSHCCQLGDTCLTDSACFNYATGVTYLYGCTDSSYSDAVCPWKCGSTYSPAPYVGITYCPSPGDLWSCTKPQSSDSSVQAQPGQTCNDNSEVAFAAPAVLDPILSLPTSAGGSTGYFSTIDATSFSVIAGYTPAQIPVNAVPSKPSTPEQVVPHTTTTTHTTKPTTTTKPPPPTTTKAATTTTPPPPPTTTTTTAPSSTTTTTTTPSTTTTTSPSAVLTSSTTTNPTTSSAIVATSSTSPSSISSSSPSTLTTSTSPTSSQSSSSTAAGAASSNSPTAAASSGLSTGAKIGIGVGVAGGVLFVLALILFAFMWRRRRRTHEPVPQQEHPYSVPYESKPAYDPPTFVTPVGAVQNRSELQGDEPVRQPGKHLSGQSDWGSSTLQGDSPTPTYTTFQNTPRPGQRPVHELSTNF